MKPQVAVSNEIKIDKGVPLPAPEFNKNRSPRKSRYPFAAMEIGDSFFWPGDKANGKVANMARMWAKYHKLSRKFSCRTVTENGVKGVRVWRIA